ncbi:RnfH family protein [Methylovulum sp.]|uniref:RnfH family protein n=1 Tax=Methylovulum sp. TaxID=1916980 RepID=UPI00261A0628|nr:RnfH family protein [Methylovulum sp.]MDD5124593.1 RnfH family protein [Methylovulum sp.]
MPNKFMLETLLDIEVAYATAEQQIIVTVKLPEGSDVGAAIAASGLLARFPELTNSALNVGIFAHTCKLTQPLKQSDRVEIYRTLRHDPKEARRQRATKR